MDLTEIKQTFDRDGFVVVRGFLTGDDLAELAGGIRALIDDVVGDWGEDGVFYERDGDGVPRVRQLHRMDRHPFFAAYQRHPRWVRLAETLVGEEVTPRPPVYFNKPPGSDFPTPPHQDNCALGLLAPYGVEMLLPVGEAFDEETGCLRYVRGSHLEGPRPHTYSGVRGFASEIADFGDADVAREVAVELAPGDLVCHHPLTVHRAFRNRSATRTRAGYSMWYRGVSAEVDPDWVRQYDAHAAEAQRVGR